MIHEIYKRFTGPNNQQMESGMLVETSNWRNEKSLLTHGYIGPPRKTQKELSNILNENNLSIKEVGRSVEIDHVKRPAPSAGSPKVEPSAGVPSVVPPSK